MDMDIVTRIKVWTGACAAATGNEDIEAVLKRSKYLLSVAATGTDLSKNLENTGNVFRQSQEGLDKISETLETLRGRCLDARALTDIYEAIKILNQDGIIQRDGETAAKAFGQLLGGFGRLAHSLPPPANAYAPILEACGGNFFNRMRKELNPEARYKDPSFDMFDTKSY